MKWSLAQKTAEQIIKKNKSNQDQSKLTRLHVTFKNQSIRKTELKNKWKKTKFE